MPALLGVIILGRVPVGPAVIYSVGLLSRARLYTHIAWTRCMRAVPYVPYGEERGKSFLVNRARVLSLL